MDSPYVLGYPYRTAPARPRPPWWRRLLCAWGLHAWTVRLAVLIVLDGAVEAPDGDDCPACGGRRVHLEHRLRRNAGCDCAACWVQLVIAQDPRLRPWQDLYALGPRYTGRAVLLACQEDAIETWLHRHLGTVRG